MNKKSKNSFIPELSNTKFEFTPEEQYQLDMLLDWQKRSAQCPYILGASMTDDQLATYLLFK